MIDCYFCHEEYEERNQHKHYQPCPECPKRWKNIKTYTTYDDEGILLNANIYVVRSKWITIPGPNRFVGRHFMGDSHYQLGWDYQFRLDFGLQKTILTAVTSENFQHIVDIPGFPISPDNAESKLDLYLTFS